MMPRVITEKERKGERRRKRAKRKRERTQRKKDHIDHRSQITEEGEKRKRE